ncbi:hypothetical protein O6H91_09G086500 [Diphasiastrum complanatum]|uniref:Uncharacterized protein n=1 Tax=Diphasiastrum complanatum TaxID=34168 RepID=A0ACC2CRN1_DIPCM|nr:hypothetical protein O6H91_09G086500 [Diphasiastrum complanatum]
MENKSLDSHPSSRIQDLGSEGKGEMWSFNKKLEQPTDLEDNRVKSLGHIQVISLAMVLNIAYRSLGVVYGDLGTSPLYVFHSTFPDGIQDIEDVVGAASLIVYTLALIPLIKYVFIVLQANDNGEGGTFALYSLICRHVKLHTIANQHPTDQKLTTYIRRPLNKTYWASRLTGRIEKSNFLQNLLLLLVLLGTCMVIGDGILTPAISVLSSVNGIKVSHPTLSQNVVVVMALLILVGVFSMQHIGTEKVAFLFAPIVLVWLLSIGSIGIYNIVKHDPTILRALSPHYIVRYFQRDARGPWSSLGGIVLSITGTEVMFADLGHFSVQSIQIAFTVLVFPCLLAAYLGQAAFLTQHPEKVSESFYRSIPAPIHWPIFVIAMFAAIVASQASISATFSIIKQAVALGCFPRVKLIYTSKNNSGQIYIPEINWILMVLCLVITGGFKNTAQIGNAYGIAVIAVMLVTTILMAIIMLIVWQSNFIFLLLFLAVFGTVELVYFSSVLFKVDSGGWVPLAIASAFLTIMYIWHYGSMKRHMYEKQNRISMGWILGLGPSLGLVRVPGIGLFYTELAHGVPSIFSHFITHLPAIHAVLVFICVKYLPVNTVPQEERFLIRRIGPKELYMFRCVARYGYVDLHKRDDDFECKFIESLESFIRWEAAAATTLSDRSDMNPFLARLPSMPGQLLLANQEDDDDQNSNSISISQEQYSSSRLHLLDSLPRRFQHYSNGNDFEEILAATTTTTTTATNTINKADNESSEDSGMMRLRLRLSRSHAQSEEEAAATAISIEDQLQFLQEAKGVGLVHIMGNTMVRARKDSIIPKRIVVNYGYAFLQRICRDSSETLHVPHESLLNVGMIYHV